MYTKPHYTVSRNGHVHALTFTGKEKDEETGYGYFGVRYIDHELMTMWLSVDPMADKYPGISPLNATHKSALRFRDTQSLPECPQDILLQELVPYCAWNPVKLVDSDGNESWKPDSDGNLIAEQGDNAATLAKFMGVSVSDAESLLQSQGYSTDVEKGSKVIDNVFTRNLAAHGKLRAKER